MIYRYKVLENKYIPGKYNSPNYNLVRKGKSEILPDFSTL